MQFPVSMQSRLCGLSALAAALSACSAAPERETTTVTTRELDVGGIVKMRRETRTTETADDTEVEPSRPQSGILTAGDYDDILNPDLYAKYASRLAQQMGGDLPFIDTRTRVAVKIVDEAGRAVPQAQIVVTRKGGTLRLVSGADGVASFYPRHDRVSGLTRISATSDAGSASRNITVSGQDMQAVTLTVAGQAHAVRALDLVLVLDTTGSMGDEMAYLQAELYKIVERLKRDAGNVDLRIGLIVYRDAGDDYIVRSYPLSGDIRSVRETLDLQDADGGGDTPEAVDRAMMAATQMQWRGDAAKAVLLVADAPPHSEAVGATLEATERLRSEGVQIVPVAASGVEDSAQYVMRTMAVLTQGRYIFLTDDSGVGNAHAEPDVSCYVVTRLDQLIARVLAGIVQGRRIEADRNEIIRTVGDYDSGRCRARQIASR